MTKWKYAVTQLPTPAQATGELNKAGAEGWELVSVVQASPSSPMLAFLKKRD